MARPSLSRAHRALLGVVAAGATLISGIGFAGSYSAVRDLAMEKGFGAFSYAFPIGVDAGIVVLLSLDLVLTWLRIPFPLLRQTAWLLTAATIAFNAAASWGDTLGMAMHAVIPVLFVVVVEASRHAVGRLAAITADRYMESVRLMRWVLSPVPTFRLWRRMKLWELRSYDETVRLEQNRLVYRAQLRFRYGRGWRRSAPFQALLPLKLAKYGVPLDPSILDRIDGPLQAVEHAQAAQAAHVAGQLGAGGAIEAGGQPGAQPGASAPVSAAVAGTALAKLAAVRLRDAQEPGHAAQPAPAPTVDELNVWTARAVRMHTEQSEGAQAPRMQAQGSPWFKPTPAPRAASVPVQAASVQGAPVQAAAQRRMPSAGGGVPVQADRGVRGASSAAAQAQASDPRFEAVDVEPIRIGHRPIRLDGEVVEPQDAEAQTAGYAEPIAYAEPLPFDAAPEADGRGDEGGAGGEGDEQFERGSMRRLPGEPLDRDACFDALLAYMDVYDEQPNEQRFAEFLTREWGMSGSRADGAVGVKDLEKIWPELRERYVLSGRAE